MLIAWIYAEQMITGFKGFGLVTSIQVPGDGWMMLYQPRHPLAHQLEM